MSYNLKKQDKFGIFTSIGITAIVLGVVFTTSFFSEEISIHESDNFEIIGIGGITDIKESIKISFDSPTIDLDTTDGLFRANVVYEGYQPQMGRVILEVYSSSGDKVKESELQLRQRGNGVYEADFIQYFDKNEVQVGQYILRISTDYGSLAKQTPFTVKMSSMEQPKQTILIQSNIITTSGIGGKLLDNAPNLGFDLETMEADLENSIMKKYLSKILIEYYDGEISKSDIKRLTEFKNIDCDLTDNTSQTGEGLQLSCDLKPNN